MSVNGQAVTKALSPRELQVLRLLCQGRIRPQIAKDIGISQNTTRTHIQNLLAKLNLDSQIQAVAWAFQTGLAQSDPLARSQPVACPNCGHDLELVTLPDVRRDP